MDPQELVQQLQALLHANQQETATRFAAMEERLVAVHGMVSGLQQRTVAIEQAATQAQDAAVRAEQAAAVAAPAAAAAQAAAAVAEPAAAAAEAAAAAAATTNHPPTSSSATGASGAGASSSSSSSTKVTFRKLSYDDAKGAFTPLLENWFTFTEAAFDLAHTREEDKVGCAILNAMEGLIQERCIPLLQAVKTWADLKASLVSSFLAVDRVEQTCQQLHHLTMAGFGSDQAALGKYIARTREMHAIVGSAMGETERFRCFYAGLTDEVRRLIATTVAVEREKTGTELPKTFESYVRLAQAATQAPVPASSTVAVPAGVPMAMDLNAMTARKTWADAARAAGWAPPPKPTPRPSGKGTGRWMPKLSNQERKQLTEQGLCLCCKASTEHRWRDCPKNPSNKRENA